MAKKMSEIWEGRTKDEDEDYHTTIVTLKASLTDEFAAKHRFYPFHFPENEKSKVVYDHVYPGTSYFARLYTNSSSSASLFPSIPSNSLSSFSNRLP